jgi:transposase
MDERNCIRVKEFRQLRKEIRGSDGCLIVGIDVAKRKHNAFFGTSTGKTLLKGLVFENTLEGFEKLLTQTESIKVRHDLQDVVFGLEPTSNYHKPLAEFLIKRCHCVVLVSGVAVKRNRELLDGRWDKHDMKDAANVADLISQGKCLFYECPSEELRDLRGLLSVKRKLKKLEHGLRIRIRNHLLAQYFPEMDKFYGHGETENLAIVRWCLSPTVIAGLGYEEFSRMVTTRATGICQEKRLRAIWEQAPTSIGCDVTESVEFEAEVLVETLKRTREAIRSTDERIKKFGCRLPDFKYLLTIPGFGPDISAKVIGAIGNPFRFENAKQVLKLAGFDLSANRSGETSYSATPVISKKGKAALRYAVYQAAFIASTRNKYFIAYYTNKLRGREREKGIKTKMRVKLAAKMLVIAWTLMKKKEPFDPGYLKID